MERTPRRDAVPGPRRRKLAAILMADVSGYTRLMRADEDGTVGRIRDFHARVRALIEAHEGRVVDTAGDSVFGEFQSVLSAVRCAIAIQERQTEQNAGQPEGERIDTRIGVHLGDVIVEDDHLFGDGVNIASRLESEAQPGGVCVSEAVYEQVHRALDVPFQELGPRRLKNIEQPLRLYELPPVGALQRAPALELEILPPEIPPCEDPDPPDLALPRWYQGLLRPGRLSLLAVSGALAATPVAAFDAKGVLPTLGAILAAVTVGPVLRRRSGTRGWTLLLLGAAIAAGALLTRWSSATDYVFIATGSVIAACGAGLALRGAEREPVEL